MQLQSVRIEAFKCIEDSEEFTVDEITCLVGKNEAGKSAVLQALHKLNPVDPSAVRFEETEYPRRSVSTYRERADQTPANVVTSHWRLSDTDMATLSSEVPDGALESPEVVLRKGYANTHEWEFSAMVPPGIREAICTALLKMLPKFLYFTEYDKLPGRISIADFLQKKQNNTLSFGERIFEALLDLTNSGAVEIQNIGKSELLIMELEAISNRLTEEIFAFWSQNRHLDVQFRFDGARPQDPAPFNQGHVFSTRIYNRRHRATVNFDERSTGFIWFFSFLVWFSRMQRTYGDNLILLLDEPGLSLHGTAQRDLLRYMNEKLRPLHQVLYSTHSPFLLDSANIFSIRTVEDIVDKDAQNRELIRGTKVGQRILSRDADTLLPLQGIAGFDIAQTMFVGPNVLVVEGPSEAGYISWFNRQLARQNRPGLDLRWAVCPAEGANKVGSFVTLFSGRGLRIAALLDYHDGQKGMVDQLEASGLLTDGCLLRTTNFVDQSDADIEDLVGRPMMRQLVNACMGLGPKHMIPETSTGNQMRVVKEIEDHCRTLPAGFSNFHHYKAVEHLLTLEQGEVEDLEDLDAALDRFERLFDTLNKLIA